LKIAIASGKGGTGKTTIATNLAVTLADSGKEVVYLDCDVEEPNGHIFIKPEIGQSIKVGQPVPEVDYQRCDFCGECARICQFNALAVVPDKVIIFPELCHSCGGCYHLCPRKAIKEIPREIGVINRGRGAGLDFVEGRLNIGEAMAPPVTRAVKQSVTDAPLIIIDAPPGTSCPVIEAVKGSDYVALITEPTPFGLNDLRLAAEMLRELGLPFGVVVNRSGSADDDVIRYCGDEDIEILLKIPDDRKIAESYSKGEIFARTSTDYRKGLENLFDRITVKVAS
jgi:MinD superfamily P-loop ATPase